MPLLFLLGTLVLVVTSYRPQLWDNISNHCSNACFHFSIAFPNSTIALSIFSSFLHYLWSIVVNSHFFHLLSQLVFPPPTSWLQLFVSIVGPSCVVYSGFWSWLQELWSIFPPLIHPYICRISFLLLFSLSLASLPSLRFAIVIASYVASHLLLCCRLCYHKI